MRKHNDISRQNAYIGGVYRQSRGETNSHGPQSRGETNSRWPTKMSELFFGDSFFDLLCQETNRYYLQNHEKYDKSYKVLKWEDVTLPEMKKFFLR
jgi:hypothetical protein